MYITEFTVEKGLMPALNVGNPLAEGRTSVPIAKFIVEKSFISTKNVINLLPVSNFHWTSENSYFRKALLV